MKTESRLLCNWGVMDCPGEGNGAIYDKWSKMIKRCHSEATQKHRPTYVGCSVCDEWRYFSVFKAWMIVQNWVDMHLDKDILFPGNKIYSSQTCVFVSSDVNCFMTDRAAKRGEYLIGVCFHKQARKFAAQVSDGHGKRIALGYFTHEIDAHCAWAYAKRNIAYRLAGEQTDDRVAASLRAFGEFVVCRANQLKNQ